MSLVSNLENKNITFKFDGSTINVDASNCDKLVECKIPFTFKDGCISFEEVKKDEKLCDEIWMRYNEAVKILDSLKNQLFEMI